MILAEHKIQHNAHLVSDLTIRKNKSGREPLKAPGPIGSVYARHGAASATQATRLGQLLDWGSCSFGLATRSG